MTRERDVDELIHTFMQGGPEELSERLLTGIRNDVHGTKQRALWRPWRIPAMPRPMIIFAALGALLVAIALRWGLDPNDLKLITAVFVFLALVAPNFLNWLGKRSVLGEENRIGAR